MAREKKKKKHLPHAVAVGPKERHRRIPKSQFDPKAPMPTGFVAKPTVPRSKSKHHTYFEFVENTNKKKKLEHQFTTKSTPPPGFEFVPTGNPALTTKCKELSREKDAMIFIVSNTKEVDPNHLSHHVHRTGHHIREAIVEEARASLGHLPDAAVSNGQAEALPTSQSKYTTLANAAIVDLFPRIPNTDRQSIITHAFNLASMNQRPKPVGLCFEMPLSRRVQLAVVAHIRHTHTRYDELLKETSWQNARKVVEALCLDILVKWRGDEETGRDQLDEILREVVVISDSDSEESDEEDGGVRIRDDDETPVSSNDEMDEDRRVEHDHTGDQVLPGMSRDQRLPDPIQPQANEGPSLVRPVRGPGHVPQHRPAPRKEQRGFKRYRAWEEAIQRNREDEPQPIDQGMVGSVGHGPQQYFGSTVLSPGPMVVDGGAGSVPDPNGFVPRHPHAKSPIVPFPNSPARPLHQASSSIHDQARTTPGRSRQVTPVADRLQDMLVRSIEPASPQGPMQPSFVRALPPRPPISPGRHSAPFRPGSSSPFRDTPSREWPAYVDRRVVSDRHMPEPLPPPLPLGHPGDSYGHQPAPRRYEPRPGFHSPLSAPDPRPQPPGVAPAPARRIAVGLGRPGDRTNPILMEDRGGFFERVHEPLEANYPRGFNPDMSSARWPPPAAGRVPESPHRVVSWEEGSRILQESRNDRDVQVIPMSGPRTLPPEAQPLPARVDTYPPPHFYDPRAQREPHELGYHRGQAVEPLPLRRDYMVGPPDPRQEVPHDRQPPGGVPYYQQPVPPQYLDQARHPGPHARPEFGHRPRSGGDVIVLD